MTAEVLYLYGEPVEYDEPADAFMTWMPTDEDKIRETITLLRTALDRLVELPDAKFGAEALRLLQRDVDSKLRRKRRSVERAASKKRRCF